MADTITIADGGTTKFVFLNGKKVQHVFEVVITQMESPGSKDPAVDHEQTVFHVLNVEFEFINRGAYSGGADPGTTGDVWKQKQLLEALTGQPVNNVYYTISEDADTTSKVYNGVLHKIIFDRFQESHAKRITGSLLFLETEDVLNF